MNIHRVPNSINGINRHKYQEKKNVFILFFIYSLHIVYYILCIIAFAV